MTILSSSYYKHSSHLIRQVAAIFFVVWLLPALTQAQTKIFIRFVNKAGTEKLQLGNSYINAQGETFTVFKCKYYIHNIRLADSSGKFITVDSAHYLVEAADESSKLGPVNT